MARTHKVVIFCTYCGKATEADDRRTRFCSMQCNQAHTNQFRGEYYMEYYYKKVRTNPKAMEARRRRARNYAKKHRK